MTKNIFDVVIVRDTLKWDAVWRVIDWLSNTSEGHGLKATFRDKLAVFCFGHECSFGSVNTDDSMT